MRNIIATVFLLFISTFLHSKEVDPVLGVDLEALNALMGSPVVSAQPGSKPVTPKSQEKSTKKTEACKLPGKVIGVSDGDTVLLLDKNKKQYKIRLSGIDAPEKGQPYSKAATKYLKSLVAGKNVCVDWHKKDGYGRTVGVIRYASKDINLMMINKGFAWHFKKYQKEQKPTDQVLYSNAEKNSRLSVIGLWQEPNPIKPGDWRAGKRPEKKSKKKVVPVKKAATPTTNKAVRITPPTVSSFSCSGKRFCGQMNSCAEACYYLNQCGVRRLDRDRDGIPCESFCGGC